MSMGTNTGTSGSSGGKSSGGVMPSSGGYQPTQQAQQQFQSGMPQQQPGVAQQLNQISGVSSPAVSTMVNQQMAPSGATGLPPVMGMSSQTAQPYNNGFVPGFDPQAQGYEPIQGSSTPLTDDINTFGFKDPRTGQQFDPRGNPVDKLDLPAYMQGGNGGFTLPNGQQLDLSSQPGSIGSLFNNGSAPGSFGGSAPGSIGGRQYDEQGNEYSGGQMIQTGRPGNADVFGNMPGSPDYAPGIQITGGPAITSFEPGNQFMNSDGSPFEAPITSVGGPNGPPSPIAQPAPAPVAQPIAQPAPVARPVAQPVAKPAPAPMPTKATQGYVSRVPARGAYIAPKAPVKAAPKPVAQPVAKPAVVAQRPANPVPAKPVPAKPAPKPVVKAPVKPVRR
jgi:hypothetical protein